MKRGLLITAIAIAIVGVGFMALRIALRDRASGPNISVVETDNCNVEGELRDKPTLSISSQRWHGSTLILEVDQVASCGGHGRLSTPSYNANGNVLSVSWQRVWDPSQWAAGCRCASRLRFEISGVERKEYVIKLSSTTRLKWNGKFYDNFNDYLKDSEKRKAQ